MFDYFYGQSGEMFSYFRVPKILFHEDVADDGLLALQALVDAEEVADFACHMVRQLRDVLIGVVGDVYKRQVLPLICISVSRQ